MILRVAGGRQYVAGLFWRDRSTPAGLFWNGIKGEDRRRGIHWYVQWRGQTGFAEGPLVGADAPGGVPSLAAALSEHIGTESWMALVKGLEGRFALLKAGDGGMLADGETVYADREDAIAAFEAARDVGWPVYATRGLVEGAVDLDVETLSPTRGMAIRRAPFAGWSARRAAGVGVVAAAAAVGVGSYVFSDEIWRWFVGPEEVAEVEEEEAERTVSAAIDGVRLVEGCRAALAARPPALPGWELFEVVCEASLSDPGLQAQQPEMIDRPALVVRWRLDPAHVPAAPVWRRVAEGHLAEGWYAAGVNAADAWATQPLPAVLAMVPEGFGPRGFVAFRAAVDRVFGGGGAALQFGSAGPGGGRSVSIRTKLPAARIAGLVGRIGDMEVISLSQSGGGGWALEGRPVTPVRLLESRYEVLTGEKVDAG